VRSGLRSCVAISDHPRRYAGALPLQTQAEWTSVLHLAHRWNFSKIRALAIDKIAVIAEPVDRIVLARRYDVVQWLPLAYLALCEREDCPSNAEGDRLGMHDALKIVRTGAEIRARGTGLDHSGRVALVNEAFDLWDGLSKLRAKDVSAITPPSRPADNVLVVPAFALPSAEKDKILSHVHVESAQNIQNAIAAVSTAQNEARLIRAVSEPLIQGANEDIEESRHVPIPLMVTRQSFVAEQTRVSNRHIKLYTAQVEASKAKVKLAQEAVTSLLRRL
jgi:hypothetical protein